MPGLLSNRKGGIHTVGPWSISQLSAYAQGAVMDGRAVSRDQMSPAGLPS
jgi:hypothetical protein